MNTSIRLSSSLDFINPEKGAYTNSIDSLWQKFKEGHKTRYGTERALLNLYINEFVWKSVRGQCAVPPLGSNSGTLSTSLRFRLKVRALFIGSRSVCLKTVQFLESPSYEGRYCNFSSSFSNLRDKRIISTNVTSV